MIRFHRIALRRTAFLAPLCCLLSTPGAAADWPCWRADAARSGVTSERLEFPLAPAWAHRPAQPPAPAWPEPGREMHRLDFDFAFQPVVANGLVFFGSSADDTVRALDLDTGEVRWRFTTSGPVRFAPHIAGGRCYVAGDDGFLYCLDAATGKLVWQFRAAPNGRLLPGNGRVVSRWPCRSGVLVADGVAFLTAGMWPSEGVYVYALDAATGEEIWCNGASGAMYMPYPHGGAYAIGGVAPQGPLAASGTVLLVPTGRSVPAAFARKTGRFLYYHAAVNKTNGGYWSTVVGDVFLNPGHGGNADRHILLGEHGPQKTDCMIAYDLASGAKRWPMGSRHRVACDGETLFAVGSRTADAFEFEAGKFGKLKWRQKCARCYAVARAGNALLIGSAGAVTALGLADGAQLWSAEAPGQVRGIAVADGRLVVSTETGAVLCFVPGAARAKPPTVAAEARRRDDPAAPPAADAVLARIRHAGVAKGYALVIGQTDARLGQALAAVTRLQVVCALTNADAVAAERRRLVETGALYGSRLVVHHRDDPSRLPYPSGFANAVVVAGGAGGLSGRELYRVLRPYGGLLCFADTESAAVEKLVGEAELPEGEMRRTGPGLEVVRGKLGGAFDWDSKVASDHLVKWPLELLWFGEPGPARMVARHWRAPTPIVANGRYFAIGEYHLIAIDAFNGCELWQRRIGELFAAKRAVSADNDAVYVNFPESCVVLDAATGKVRKIHGQPPPAEHFTLEEGESGAPPGTLDELPAHARKMGRMPAPARSEALLTRVQPLTRQPGRKAYRRAYGCAKPISAAAMDFFRSGTLGFYDLAEDSGLRNFAGVKPGCGTTMIPAFGLLIANEGAASCSCSYNFQTSIAMGPAAQRRNEDWAVFSDRIKVSPMRRIAFNFGAPGDRRDERGLLWLGVPRPKYVNRKFLGVPCHLRFRPGFGTHRVNSDRRRISGTERPWVYASVCRGLEAATLDLLYYDPTELCVCPPCPQPPEIDGELGDECWDGMARLTPRPDAAVFLREDKDNLYVAYERRAAVDRKGVRRPWAAKASGADAPVWKDDSFELCLKNERVPRYVHLGVSASGARYEGFWENAFAIPRLADVAVDGSVEDWGERGLNVNLYDRGACRLGWSDAGLFLFVELPKDFFIKNRAFTGFFAMVSRRRSRDLLELAVEANSQTCVTAQLIDGKPEAPTVRTAETKTDAAIRVEALFPWQSLKVKPRLGQDVGFHMFFYNPKKTDPTFEKERDWRLLAFRYREGIAGLRLSEEVDPRAVRVGSHWFYNVLVHGRWHVEEDVGWNGEWASAVKADEKSFRAEMAIPWKTLAAANLTREKLALDVCHSGTLSTDAERAYRKFTEQAHSIQWGGQTAPPAPYTVRLHFAELADVEPGRRVFDVKLQGQVVCPDLDVRSAAGGRDVALVREFKGVSAAKTLELELVPKTSEQNVSSVPIISGIEVIAEE